jgi:4-hydroxy-3-methylbut-2-en-1-yl diphosphate synthase IspG/GcpE
MSEYLIVKTIRYSFIPLLNAEIYVNDKLVAEHKFIRINKQIISLPMCSRNSKGWQRSVLECMPLISQVPFRW